MSDDGFQVVPTSLIKMATALTTAAQTWHGVASQVVGMRMEPLDLGLLGAAKDYPGRYNELKDLVHDQLDEGVVVWQEMAEAMKTVAETYAAKDAEWYEQFGYLAESQD